MEKHKRNKEGRNKAKEYTIDYYTMRSAYQKKKRKKNQLSTKLGAAVGSE
jgi:hypothetical protein